MGDCVRQYHIAAVSWGKDSLAMLYQLIELGCPLDEVMFYDTGMEFQAIYDERDRFLRAHPEIKYVEFKPEEPFYQSMFVRPVPKKGTKAIHKYGYGWCGGVCRWGTTAKNKAMDDYAKSKNAIVYVGIAADEANRTEGAPEWKQYPLIDWNMTEADCLAFCYVRGVQWLEGDICLYDILDRVSCWCCRNKNLKELEGMYRYLPEYWGRLRGIEHQLGVPMKDQSGWLPDLEKRWVS